MSEDSTPHKWVFLRPYSPHRDPSVWGGEWGCSQCGRILRSNQEPGETEGRIKISIPKDANLKTDFTANCGEEVMNRITNI